MVWFVLFDCKPKIEPIELSPPSKTTEPIAPAAPPPAYAAIGFAIVVIGEFGKKRSRTAPTRAAAPTPATTFPIVPLLNMFPILLVDLVEDLRFLMLLRGLVDLKGCDFRRLVVDLLRLLGVDLDDFRLFNATSFLVAAFCLAVLLFLAKVFSIFRSTFRYSLG